MHIRALLLLACLCSCTAQPSGAGQDLGQPDAGPEPGQDLGTAPDAQVMDAGPRPDAGLITPDAGTCEPEVPRVRYKRARRIELHFLQALGLAPGQLCNELGRFGCAQIHQVALGGVDPYALGLYEPLPQTTATTPLAIDRLALSGCRARVDIDLGSDAGGLSPLIFGDLPINARGGLDPDAPQVEAALVRLYQRALSRNPSAEELEQLRGFYAQVQTEQSQTPARDWALLSCYAVLTTVESLFY